MGEKRINRIGEINQTERKIFQMDFTKAKTFDPESIVQDRIFMVLMLTTRKCGEQNTSFI